MIHSKRKINSVLLFERKILFILSDCGATHITRWKITQNYATDLCPSQRLKGSDPILASKRVLICHVRLWSRGTGLFNLISPVPSTDDLSKSWRVISDWTIVPFYELFRIHLTSHQFTPHGRYELNKLTSFPTCGFIVQLVEHRTSIAQITVSNPVEALIFSGFFFPIAQIGKINCDGHSSLSSKTAVQIWITTIFVDTRPWKTKKPAGNISKISVSLVCYWQIRLKSTNNYCSH